MENPNTIEKVTLYQPHKVIHNRSVSGWFNNLRNFFLVLIAGGYYILPWIMWQGRQAVLFDISNREFHIFNVTFLPQDVLYLSLLLIISAYTLFLFTAIAGRLFCGYTCPQTIFSMIYMKIEKWVEGEHTARKRLSAAPMSFTKFRIKATKLLIWIVIGLYTGFTFIAYFDPLYSVIHDIKNFSLGAWQTFFFFFSAFLSLLFAAFMREQVCKFMCPYARFQSVMFDKDTLIVSYDPVIGEPRGKRKKDTDIKAENLGFCTDCGVCVEVCPTGIDIRKGLQYECIGCGACIDGCDQIMEKMNYPKGLIRYTSDNGIANRWLKSELIRRIFRARIYIYSAILVVLFIALIFLLATRNPVKTTIIQDRASMSRILRIEKMIEGVYQLRIVNSEPKVQKIMITPSGIDGIKIENINLPIEVPPESTETFIFNVRVPMANVDFVEGVSKKDVSYNISFEINSIDDKSIHKIERSTFMVRHK